MTNEELRSALKGDYSVIEKDVEIGQNTTIWNLSYIGHGAVLGSDVIIGSLVHVGRNTVIGDGTRIEGGVYIAHNSRIGKNCFIGPQAVLTDDPFPPVRRVTGVEAWTAVVVEDEAIIGAGARLRAGIRVGRRAVVGMGAVVLSDVPPEAVVVGVPARVLYSRSEYDDRQREWARTHIANPVRP